MSNAAWIQALALASVTLAAGPAETPRRVDMAAVASGWTADFSVRGMKTEPTFIEHVQYARNGDRFTLEATIAGEDVGAIAIDLDPEGHVAMVNCSSAASCPPTARNGILSAVAACPDASECALRPPNGFLSTVAVLAALRAGRLTGEADVVTYAGRETMCVPLDAIQPDLDTPVVMDPCLDLETGAVLAHRRRYDNQFGGATLDESSLLLTSASPTRGFNFSLRK